MCKERTHRVVSGECVILHIIRECVRKEVATGERVGEGTPDVGTERQSMLECKRY